MKKASQQKKYISMYGRMSEAGPEIVWVYISYLRNKLKSISADIEIEGEQGGSFKLVSK